MRIQLCLLGCMFTLLTYCSLPQNELSSKKGDPAKLTSVLSYILKEKYPNYEKNELSQENALNEIIAAVDSLAPLHYLEDIPLEIFRIQKNPHGKGAIVQLYTGRRYLTDTAVIAKLRFEVISLMPDSLAIALDEEKEYMIRGKKYKRLSDEVYMIVGQTFFSPTPNVEEYIGIHAFQAGIFMCEVDSMVMVGYPPR